MIRWNSSKLAPLYYGPYQVIERFGVVAYRLQLPDSSQVHPIFHCLNTQEEGGPSVGECQNSELGTAHGS